MEPEKQEQSKDICPVCGESDEVSHHKHTDSWGDMYYSYCDRCEKQFNEC